ncbi:MAG: O-antigen ligase family protein [Bacteroidales bacterium]
MKNSIQVVEKFKFVILVLCSGSLGLFLLKIGLNRTVGFFVVFLILGFVFFYIRCKYNIYNLLIISSFIIIGINRYLYQFPLGLVIDFLLILLFISVIINNKQNRKELILKSPIFFFALIWFLYVCILYFNPLVNNKVSWFYAMRSICLYLLIISALFPYILNKLKYLQRFIYLWGVFAIFASIKAIIQRYIGLDYFEQLWFDHEGFITHMIHGNFRAFSFMSDAGQFGAFSAASFLMGFKNLLSQYPLRQRLFFLCVCLFSLIGLLLSGTRGGYIVITIGLIFMILLSKQFKSIVFSFVLFGIVIAFFRFSNIGDNYSQVRRIRSAFFPFSTPSFIVRLENQKRLFHYLKDKPMGTGIGTSGNWGKRFHPESELSEIPTDSWLVQIWVETGFVGITLYMFMFIFFILKMIYVLRFKLKEAVILNLLLSIFTPTIGVFAASYANGIIGQLPLSILIIFSINYICHGREIEKEYLITKEFSKKQANAVAVIQ